jgi:hypothetical protein
MKTLLYIGLLLISISSFAQIDTLTIDFKPSFIENSTLIFENKSDNYLMTIKTDNLIDSSYVSDTALTDLKSYFKEYNFAHKGSIDTIGQEKVIENGDTVEYYQLSMGFDGINVYGKLVENDYTKYFKFWSPDKDDKNHKLIEILFRNMYEHFDKAETIVYLERLEQYFDFGLGLKKISENPLVYKLYGSLTSSEETEIIKFFNELPQKEKVTIDVTNLSGMGTMFYDIIGELVNGKTNLYWSVKYNTPALYHLRKIGILDEYIISDYRIKKIREDGYSRKIKYKKIK